MTSMTCIRRVLKPGERSRQIVTMRAIWQDLTACVLTPCLTEWSMRPGLAIVVASMKNTQSILLSLTILSRSAPLSKGKTLHQGYIKVIARLAALSWA